MKMKMKWILMIAATSILPWSVGALAAPKVVIRSEIASPVVLENVQSRNYLKISLLGAPVEKRSRTPINLALVIDRSSSMSGDKIEKARDAAILAVNLLEADDTLSVIAYDSTVEVIVPATKVSNKRQLTDKNRRNLQPRGMTALFAGVSKGLDQVGKHLDKRQVNRIILLSDGQANVGPASISELSELARIAAKKGVAITTLGIGQHYNEDLMTAIAGFSDGNHAFVENATDLERTFAREFDDVMSVVAQDVEVIIRTASDVRPVRLLGREGEIRGNTVTVRLNQLYSNQEKYVLLEVVPAQGKRSETRPLADVDVRYDDLAMKKQITHQDRLALRYTDSEAEARNAVVEDVLVDSAIQQMALENERAVKLLDAGQINEAKDVLEQSTQQLEAMQISTPEAKKKIQENVELNKNLRSRMEHSNESVFRKALKEQTYNVRQQNKMAP